MKLLSMAITINLLTLRLAFVSAGLLSTALMLKLSVPVLIEFLNCEVPYLWSVAVVWLKPPYLYLVLNCIIITIVASTKLQPQQTDGFAVVASIPVEIKVQEDVIFADPLPIKPVLDLVDSDSVVSSFMFENVDDVAEKKLPETTPGEESVPEKDVASSETEMETEKEFAISTSNCTPPRKRDPAVKPLVSQSFSNRKSVKLAQEGLGVTKPKQQDTLESTWRMITEGRSMPLTRHLKKSETFDTRDESPATSDAPSMKKAETFNEHSKSQSPGGEGGGLGRVRRELSLSQDELNRRVEEFIRKFNEEMRLQRLQSLQQYSDMVGRETV